MGDYPDVSFEEEEEEEEEVEVEVEVEARDFERTSSNNSTLYAGEKTSFIGGNITGTAFVMVSVVFADSFFRVFGSFGSDFFPS